MQMVYHGLPTNVGDLYTSYVSLQEGNPNSESGFDLRGPVTRKWPRKTGIVLEPCWNLSLLRCKAGLILVYNYPPEIKLGWEIPVA